MVNPITPGMATCFRRVNPAASLKRGEPDNARHGNLFPPGKSGGLIEAREASASRAAPIRCFRR